MKMSRKAIYPFIWHGSKFSHLSWLLPLLPKCHHYCEPFGGSGSVLLNREPSPVETYNDIDGEVVNFFRVLRQEKDKLIEAIGLTPFSREEFAISCVLDKELPPFERARRFFVRAQQVRIGLAQRASFGRWNYNITHSRTKMSGSISNWLGKIDNLPEVAERLLRVQIENKPAIDVILTYDSPSTLFYCDPPYVQGTRTDARSYKFEMKDHDHVKLAELLNNVRGMVAISGYQCNLMDDLYPSSKWYKSVCFSRTKYTKNGIRNEALWTNYDPNDTSLLQNNSRLLFDGFLGHKESEAHP